MNAMIDLWQTEGRRGCVSTVEGDRVQAVDYKAFQQPASLSDEVVVLEKAGPATEYAYGNRGPEREKIPFLEDDSFRPAPEVEL
jgi:hypothetical protein